MMNEETKKNLIAMLLGLLVVAGFMTGILGMALSEKKGNTLCID
jgi:hypothetical protein